MASLFNNAAWALDAVAFQSYSANHRLNRAVRRWKKGRVTMNRLCLLAVVAVLMFTLGAGAQQPTTRPDAHAVAAAPVEQHLKVLSEKLALTADQQDKARPILQEMHDGSQKLEEDQSLTPEQRHEGMVPVFMKADKALREILTDDQKKKLDDMETQMHGGPQDSPRGATTPPQGN
jgi:hypothetical protein